MLKKFVGRFILNYKIKRRRKAKWTWKWKWFIGTACRWIRRTFTNLCQIDLKANAKGLAKIYQENLDIRIEESTKENTEKFIGNDAEHFQKLSQETDPLENIDEIPENSVNMTHTNIETIDRR